MAEPNRVAAAIDDLAQEVGRWSGYAAAAADEALYEQRQITELARRSEHDAAFALDIVFHHEAGFYEVGVAAGSAEEAAAQLTVRVARRRASLERTQQVAQQAVAAWQNALRRAEEWEQRSTERVRLARDRERQLVVRSNSSLLSGVSDETSGRRLRRRPNDFSGGRDDLAAARQEISDAQADNQEASRQRAGCATAIQLAGEALLAAERAVAVLAGAELSSTLAGEYGLSTQVALRRSGEALDQERLEAEAMTTAARSSIRATELASRHLGTASAAYQDGQRLAFDAQRDLHDRIERLREFNRPNR